MQVLHSPRFIFKLHPPCHLGCALMSALPHLPPKMSRKRVAKNSPTSNGPAPQVCVYAPKQPSGTRPLYDVSRDRAAILCREGYATRINKWEIRLTEAAVARIHDQSCFPGTVAMHGVVDGAHYFVEMIKRWRFGFVEPPRREESLIRVLRCEDPLIVPA